MIFVVAKGGNVPDRRENRIRLRNHFRGTEAHQKCIAVRRIKVRRCLQRESGESFGSLATCTWS